MGYEDLEKSYAEFYKEHKMIFDKSLQEEYKEIYDYLYFIKDISKLNQTGLYGLDQQRCELHYAMFSSVGLDVRNDSEMYIKSKVLTDNLDVMIDFDIVRDCVTPNECLNMNHWLRCQEFYFFVTGKTTAIRAKGKAYS